MSTKRYAISSELFPARYDANGKRICRYCGGKLPPRRSAWCSEKCHDEAWVRLSPGFAASAAEKRDGGVCQDCGWAASKARRIFWTATRRLDYYQKKALTERLVAAGFPEPRYESWTQVHHVIPVAKGGGLCGLENLVTLCVACHKARHKTRPK